MSSQIRAFFARQNFLSIIPYRFKRKKLHDNNYDDIYDGYLYQQLIAEDGILACNNISLTWDIDGLPPFKSSKFSLWPMYFVINELPYKLLWIRTENMIIAGLWFGEAKPT